MKKVNQYLPTEEEIVTFFENHSGPIGVIRLTELLISGKVNHTTPHEEEWKHVRGILYSLKSRDIVVVKEEGKQVIEELFYSTPDRIEKYHNPDTDKPNSNITKTIIGVVNNNGVMPIGDYTKTENVQNEKIQSARKQIILIVIGGAILAILLYAIYVVTGINLQSPGI
ncbi:MAG: hypothetical protein KBC62_02675 [Candidatus Pacebacteria bacterium]|jgi:hypothetical protein|nr:hypothetical protein [Candidatus Paceibacterota bacterium]